MAESCYYACSATVNAAEHFFLWFSDDTDGVVLNGSRILTFPSRDALAEHCINALLALSDESPVSYDFDATDKWIRTPDVSSLDVPALLNTWNMMDDFSNSLLGRSAIADGDLDLHEKLSLSNFTVSMPGVMVDENYDAKWTSSDLSRLAKILDESTAKFKASL